MGTVYDLLMVDDIPYSLLITEHGDRIIIGSQQTNGDRDVRSTYEMTEAFIQIQTVDPITLTPVGSFRLNSTITLPTPTFGERILTITNTDTIVPVPQGATVAVITPGVGNASVLTLKGATGDTGVLLANNNPSCLTLANAQNTIMLNSNPNAVYMFTFV